MEEVEQKHKNNDEQLLISAVMRSADSIQLRLEDLKLDYDDCKRWYDNAYKKYEDDRKMSGRGEADANEYLDASRQLELIKVQIKQLDDVYQQDDIRSKRADIEFLENKLKEKADEFDRVGTKLAYQLRAKGKIVESYAASARVIHLHLKDYCNEELPYDEMIADASRLAACQINELKREIEELKSRINID